MQDNIVLEVSQHVLNIFFVLFQLEVDGLILHGRFILQPLFRLFIHLADASLDSFQILLEARNLLVQVFEIPLDGLENLLVLVDLLRRVILIEPHLQVSLFLHQHAHLGLTFAELRDRLQQRQQRHQCVVLIADPVKIQIGRAHV